MTGTQRDIPRTFVAIVLVLAALRIAVEAGWMGLPGTERRDLIAWEKPASAEKRAREEGKALLIDFDADWCAPCRQLDAVTWHDAELADRIGRRFVAARVTASAGPADETEGGEAWRNRFGVQAFPTLVVVVPGSPKALVRRGYQSPAQVQELLDQAELASIPARRVNGRSPRDPTPSVP